jgi:DNA modification methylase
MTVYQEPNVTIYQGHALDVLKGISAESVDCVMTSPPYWGLRTYKTEPQIWGENHCEHEFVSDKSQTRIHKGWSTGTRTVSADSPSANYDHFGKAEQGNFCLKCHAWRGELGLEPTIELYISHLVQIFDEVKRVLKKTGTCWVNIDDSYWSTAQGTFNAPQKIAGESAGEYANFRPKGGQAKSLCLIPSRFALAMVEHGWILRNDIVWYKSNPMPESVKDRFTGTWEHLFFFVKSKERSNDIKRWLPESLANDDRAWLAAMIDAEGTIGIRKSVVNRPHDTFGAYITINNSCKAILDRCVAITGIGGVKDAGASTNLAMYRWEITHNDALSIIGEVYPYLIGKREQAKVCVALQKTNYHRGSPKGSRDGPIPLSDAEYQEKIRLWELCKALNQHEVEFANLPEPNLNRHSGCEDYFFEQQFEPHTTEPGSLRDKRNEGYGDAFLSPLGAGLRSGYGELGRNKRDVWEINTEPTAQWHGIKNFATFPEKLCETPILSGCPTHICKKCGKEREKVYQVIDKQITDAMRIAGCDKQGAYKGQDTANYEEGLAQSPSDTKRRILESMSEAKELGYTDCGCNAGFEPGVVLDPFCGSGKALSVAKRLGRKCIGIDLNPDYCKLAIKEVSKISIPMEL